MDRGDKEVNTESKLIARLRSSMERWPIFRLESERAVLESKRKERGRGLPRREFAQLQAIKLVLSARRISDCPYYDPNQLTPVVSYS